VLLLHARIDSRIFLFALLHMPARQTVFDLAVRPRVLLEHGDSDSVIRQNFRSYGTGNRAANYRHEMMPRMGHMVAGRPGGYERHCTTQSRKASPVAGALWRISLAGSHTPVGSYGAPVALGSCRA